MPVLHIDLFTTCYRKIDVCIMLCLWRVYAVLTLAGATEGPRRKMLRSGQDTRLERGPMSEMTATIADTPALNRAAAINSFSAPRTSEVTRQEVVQLIERIGVIPALRNWAAPDASFIAETLAEGGIPVIEVSTTDPGALELIARLQRHANGIVIGAGNVFTTEMAGRCLEAGAKFLASDLCLPQIVEFATRENVAVIPGALTPTEVMTAWSAGADFVKVTPCGTSEHDYIRSLKTMMPDVRLVAAGGITQHTALNFVKAGASALSASNELVQPEAVRLRQANRMREMARRFLNAVASGRELLS
jgi:2-dehydro-3-deoxyphosphogluconate aldolase/(4S)-4-hydroxy-2-oxoglutarate aldolase